MVIDTRTAYQHLVIARTAQGLSLFCDDDRQSTEFSQLTYHEALMVPALLLADHVERVLVIGSSEGVVCQMAITAEAVRLCAEHLPYGYTTADVAAAQRCDGPIRLHFIDGYQYIATTAERYDIVLVDLPDERDEPAQHNRLYGRDFLTKCKQLLRPGGVVVSQAGCQTMWRNTTLIRMWARFNAVFGTVAYYGSDEHEWAYLLGRADSLDATTEVMVDRLPSCGYRPETIDDLALRGNSIPPYSVRTFHR